MPYSNDDDDDDDFPKVPEYEGSNAFDIAFEPLIPFGKGKRVRRICFAEALLHQAFQKACRGEVDGMRCMLRVIKANEKARAKQAPRNPGSPELAQFCNPTNIDRALLILRIAVNADESMRYVAYDERLPFGEPFWFLYRSLYLEPWAVDESLQRRVPRSLAGHSIPPGIARFTRNADTPLYRGCGSEGTSTRFQKGRSGNPKGRPRKRKYDLPFGGFLEENVQVSVNGVVRKMSRLAALVYHLGARAMKGNEQAARLLNAVFMELTVARHANDPNNRRIRTDYGCRPLPTSFYTCLLNLGIAQNWKHKSFRLEPWIVEAALARFGDRQLTRQEQKAVMRAIRAPSEVTWPDWWG